MMNVDIGAGYGCANALGIYFIGSAGEGTLLLCSLSPSTAGLFTKPLTGICGFQMFPLLPPRQIHWQRWLHTHAEWGSPLCSRYGLHTYKRGCFAADALKKIHKSFKKKRKT